MEAHIPSPRALPRLLRSALAVCALVGLAAGPVGCGGDDDAIDAPAITTAPMPQSVIAGQPAVFEVAASGAALQYQWRREGADIADAATARYTVAQAQAGDHGQAFSVTVHNAGGSVTSAAARLSVLAITAAPQPTEVSAGQPARFTVTTTGDGVSLQWQRNGIDVTGATQATLILDSATLLDDQSQWAVKVSNAAGSLLSSPVRLGVKPSASGSLELVAGDPGGPGNLDGIGSAARFSFITGLALDTSGLLWVVDGEYKVLRQLRPDGQVLTVVGAAGSTQMVDGPAAVARFVSITQLVWSAGLPAPALYVLDAGRLRRVDADGHVTTISSAEVGHLDGPLATARFSNLGALAAHADGSLVVSEYRDCAVRKIDLRSGQVSTLARSPVCEPDFNVPPALGGITALAVDGQGRINALTNGVVLRIDATGQVTLPSVFDRSLPYPYNVSGSRLAVDAAGRVHFYVAGATSGTGSYQGLLEDGSLAPGATTVSSAGDLSPFVITPAGRFVHADAELVSLRADGGGQPGTVLAGAAVDPARAVAHPIAVQADGALLRLDKTPRPFMPFGSLNRRMPSGEEEVIALQQAFAGYLSEMVSDGQGGVYTLQVEPGFCITGYCSPSPGRIDHIAASGQVRLLAGSSRAGESDGVGAAAEFESPHGLTLAPSGDLFVITPGRIRRVTPTGVVSTFASDLSSGGVLAADRLGHLYFSGITDPVIRKFTPQGQSSVFYDPQPISSDESRLLGASGLAVAANGDVLVARCLTHTVDRITAAGETRTVVGVRGLYGIRTGSLPGSLSCPSRLSWDGSDALVISTGSALLKARFSP